MYIIISKNDAVMEMLFLNMYVMNWISLYERCNVLKMLKDIEIKNIPKLCIQFEFEMAETLYIFMCFLKWFQNDNGWYWC